MATYDVTALDTPLEFDTTRADSKSMVRIPGTDRVAIAWYQSTTLVYVQAFNVNKTTGAITAIGSPLDIEAGTSSATEAGISLVLIDASNLAVFWVGADADGYCRLLSVDGTGNITANGSVVEYSTDDGRYPTSVLMDSTHILNVWQASAGFDGFAAIFTVNTGTGSISLTGTRFEFNTSDYSFGNVVKLSATKAVVFYAGVDSDGYATVLDINTSTWAVTAAGATFEFRDAGNIRGNSIVVMDDAGSPMRVVNGWNDSDAGDSEIQSFSINTSTWAVTAFGTLLDLSTSGATENYAVTAQKVDDTHALVFYEGASANGFARVLTYNAGTGALTATANELNFETNAFQFSSSVAFIETPGFFVCAWSGLGTDGFVQAFQVTMPVLFNPAIPRRRLLAPTY